MSMLLFPSSIIPLSISSFHFLTFVFYNDVKRNKRVHLHLFWTNRSFLSLVIYSIEFISLNKERRILTEHLHHNIWHRKLDHRYTTNSVVTHIVASQSTMIYERIVHTPSLLLPHSILSPISTQLDLIDRQLSSSQKTNTTTHTRACIPFQSPCLDSSYHPLSNCYIFQFQIRCNAIPLISQRFATISNCTLLHIKKSQVWILH